MGQNNVRGFSLIELSIAVFVLALLLGGLFVPLQSQVDSRRFNETNRILDQAREALLGYVSANGYFPCPASATSNGQEAPTPNHATGAATPCPAAVTGNNVYAGFLPAVTLGMANVDSSGYAIDAWSNSATLNRIRYAVSSVQSGAFLEINGMRNWTMDNILASNQLLYVCRTGTGVTTSGCAAASDALANNAIAVVWSLGANAGAGGAAPHEDKNYKAALTSYTRVLVMAERSNQAGNVFDDQMTWIGPPLVFNRLIAVGLLP